MKTQWLNRSIWILAVLLVSLLVGCGESRVTSSFDRPGFASDGSGGYTVAETHSISADGVRELTAETVNGSIVVETSSDATSVSVKVTKVVRGPSRQLSVDFERILQTQVERVGDEVRIKTTWPQNTDGYDASVEYVIVAPEGLRQTLGTVNGSILIDGHVSEAVVATVNGGVEFKGTSRSVTMVTVNGRVAVDVGQLSGESRFAAVNGSIDVVVRETPSPVIAATTNGSVSVTVAPGFAGHLDAQTSSGSAGSDFSVSPQQPVRPNRLVGRIGEVEGPSIQLRSTHGDVRLRRG